MGRKLNYGETLQNQGIMTKLHLFWPRQYQSDKTIFALCRSLSISISKSTQPLKRGKSYNMLPGGDKPYISQLWSLSSSSSSPHPLILLACYCCHINRGKAVCNSRCLSLPLFDNVLIRLLPCPPLHYFHCLRTNTNLYPSWKIKEYDNPRCTSNPVWTNSLADLI